MKKAKKMPVECTLVGAQQKSVVIEERSLDFINSPGCYSAKIKHTSSDVGLSLGFCSNEHYITATLIVTESGTDDELQRNRLIGQTLIMPDCNDGLTRIFTRAQKKINEDYVWSDWCIIAQSGIDDKITNTGDIISKVTRLMSETKEIKTYLSLETARTKEAEAAITKDAILSGSLNVNPNTDNVTIAYRNINGTEASEINIPAATTEKAGVMSAEDKEHLLSQIKDYIHLSKEGFIRCNLYDSNDANVTLGKFISSIAGDLAVNDNYLTTGYIPFTKEMECLIPSCNSVTMEHSGAYYALYDAKKNIVAAFRYNMDGYIATWQEGVAYARFSIQNYTQGNIQVEIGNVVTAYMPYGTYKLKDSISVDDIPDYSIPAKKTKLIKENFYNPDDVDVKVGYYFNSDNDFYTANDNYLITGYIPFTKEMESLISSCNGNTMRGSSAYFNLYNANKERILGYKYGTENEVAKWQEGVAYARFSIQNYTQGNIQVEIGNVVTQYIPYGKSRLDNNYNTLLTLGMAGGVAGRNITQELNDGEIMTLESYPYYLKKGNCISFSADVVSFEKLFIGKGYQKYRGAWIEIDDTYIILKKYESAESIVQTVAHGLQIGSAIRIAIYHNEGNIFVVVQTHSGIFKTYFEDFGYEFNFEVFSKSVGSQLKNCVINATNTDFRKPVWAVGDSYFGVANNRWIGAIKELGFFNFLINGLAGQTSTEAYKDLGKMLKHGTPKYLLWCMGMNDSDAVFESNFIKVKDLCDTLNIELIAALIPSVPSRAKESINQIVRSMGVRYIDFYSAVGTSESGEWIDGYLSVDGVHPTDMGAQALAMQVLMDFPELMQYGILKNESDLGNIEGDK